jgi:hypothetical protein
MGLGEDDQTLFQDKRPSEHIPQYTPHPSGSRPSRRPSVNPHQEIRR